jgi:hypothetical protein
VSSFLTSLKEGEKLIEEDRMHGLAKWNQIVSDAISSTTLTSLIRKAAADKARPPVRVVLISGGYYAGVAAKLDQAGAGPIADRQDPQQRCDAGN